MTHRDLTDEQNAALRAEIVRWWAPAKGYAGATDEDIARAVAATGLVADVDRSTIARIRNGKGGGSIMLALAVCAARGIDISQVMGRAWADRFYGVRFHGTPHAQPALGKDAKRMVQESSLYLEMPEMVRRAFDTIADQYTSSADAERKVTILVLSKKLIALKEDYDNGHLVSPDELLPGAQLIVKDDPDAHAATTATRVVSSGSTHARADAPSAKPAVRAKRAK